MDLLHLPYVVVVIHILGNALLDPRSSLLFQVHLHLDLSNSALADSFVLYEMLDERRFHTKDLCSLKLADPILKNQSGDLS